MSLVLAAYVLVSYIAGRIGRDGFVFGFSRFAYAYIPLALAGHLAHNFFHLLMEGPMALQAALEQLGWRLEIATEAAAMNESFMTATSVAMVLVGLGGGLYILTRIGKSQSSRGWRAAVPHLVLLLVMGALYLQMFILPMNPRHAH